jgi:hypothetical protein
VATSNRDKQLKAAIIRNHIEAYSSLSELYVRWSDGVLGGDERIIEAISVKNGMPLLTDLEAFFH